jgi:hypothetical protein
MGAQDRQVSKNVTRTRHSVTLGRIDSKLKKQKQKRTETEYKHNQNTSECNLHTHTTQRRHFLDVSGFCRVHILRRSVVN